LALVGAGGLVAWALAQGPPAPVPDSGEDPPRLVRVAEVAPGTHRFRVRTHGTVAPRTESDLVTEVAGQVVWASPALAAGGFFEKGERLLEIDPRDYRNAVSRAKARAARAESELRFASVELVRRKALVEREVTSAAALDRAQNAESVARATLAEVRAELERAQLDLTRTRLTAPYAGRVRRKHIDVGQFAARGTPVARVYAVDLAEVRLPVRDADLAFLDLPIGYRGAAESAEGPAVLLRARFAGGAHEWRARIVRTEGEIDAATRMLHLVARVDDPYGRHNGRPPLAVGLFVEAEILGRELDDVLVLPRSALSDPDVILVVDGENRLRRRHVEVLRNEGDHAVVRAALAAGERLCLSSIERPVDGLHVRPVAAGPEAATESVPPAVARRAP
jgi:RND family efflux transporter MFP subunit